MIIHLTPSLNPNPYSEVFTIEWTYWIWEGISHVIGSDKHIGDSLEAFLAAVKPETPYRYWFSLNPYRVHFCLAYAGNQDKCVKYQINSKAEIDHTSAESWMRSIQQAIFIDPLQRRVAPSLELKPQPLLG